MDKYDAPIDLILDGHAIADTDYGARGPQSAVNAQIPLPTRLRERNADSPADSN
jgi:indolepyruvate decarboxylase